jgi:hypothetical protein
MTSHGGFGYCGFAHCGPPSGDDVCAATSQQAPPPERTRLTSQWRFGTIDGGAPSPARALLRQLAHQGRNSNRTGTSRPGILREGQIEMERVSTDRDHHAYVSA